MMTREIWDKVTPIADKNESWPTYHRTRSYLPCALDMMSRGWLIDAQAKDEVLYELQRSVRRYTFYLNYYAKRVWGKPLNHRSPLQLKEFFYEALAIPAKFANKKGEVNISTDRNTLEGIARDYIRGALFARIILKLRDEEKMIQTLSVGLRAGRWHCSYNVAGTETFRWSSSAHPLGFGANDQNIKDRMRRMFIPDPGFVILNFDQQGAEARVVGYKCGDENYIKAFEGGDVHTMVASMCFGFEPLRELADEKYYRDWSYRDISKRATHGCVTADHEVLTLGGWKPIAQVTVLDKVACWHKDDRHVEFLNPISTTAYAYTGKMHELNGTAFSLRATHDHRMAYRNDSTGLREGLLEDLVKKRAVNFPVTANVPAFDPTLHPDRALWLRRLAAIQADADIATGSVRFHLAKRRKIERVNMLFGQLSWKKDKDKNAFSASVPTSTFRCSAELKNPGWWMLQWTPAEMATWLDETQHWDCHRNGSLNTFYSVKPLTVAVYQTIAALVGRGTVHQGSWQSGFGSTCYRVSQNRRQYADMASMDIKVEAVVDEPVYCLTVPTTFFMVRRNNKISVTGNTSYGGTARTIAKVTKLEEMIIEAFQAKLRLNFPGIFEWQRWVAWKIQTTGKLTTAFGDTRVFFGRTREDSVIREAIAFEPQSTVGRHTANGLERLHTMNHKHIQLLGNGHDAVTMQVPVNAVPELVPLVKSVLRTPIDVVDIHGVKRTMDIPWDCQVGMNRGKAIFDKKSSTWINPNGMKDYKDASG